MNEGDGGLGGKVALVTGASRNLPAVIAAELAAAGATVAANARTTSDDIQRLVEGINRERPGCARVYLADVSSATELRQMIGRVQADLGDIDILVNAAGPFVSKYYLELAEGDWDRIINSNLKAVYLATQLVAPHMMRRGWGRIINISSSSSRMHVRNHSVYSLGKAALNFLTEQLALELGPAVTVNAVAPGQMAESGPAISRYDPTFVPRAIAASPTGRLVTRREVAHMVVLLCTAAFDSVTGQVIFMDGGWSLPRF